MTLSPRASTTVSAYRSDEEPWRIERLNELLASLSSEIAVKIGHVHDHKAVPFVSWNTDPSPPDLNGVTEAWKQLDEDGDCHHSLTLSAELHSAVTEARRQAELAYRFSPGSYTYAAFTAAMKAEALLLRTPTYNDGGTA